MRKLLLTTLLSSAFVFQAFSSYEEVEDIVSMITASSSLTAEQSQELTDKLREYEKELVEHTNFVNQHGVPIWHQVLDGNWAPEVLDFLLDNGADLEAHHPISGNTALLDLAIPKTQSKWSPNGHSSYAKSMDYDLAEQDVESELDINPKFAESYELNKSNYGYKKKLNDLYRMWYLIKRGADIYAVNSEGGPTLADLVRENLRSCFWDKEDWLDLRERMIAYKESRRASMQLPTILQGFVPIPGLHTIVGSYAYQHDNHPPLSEDDGVEKIDEFFASVHAD